jgi:hypothetical protein
MTAGPVRDSARERRWRLLISEQPQSDLTIEAFCRQRQLAPSAFHYWKRELRTRDAQYRTAAVGRRTSAKQRVAATPRFLPVIMADAPTARPACSTSVLELALPGDIVLRVPPGFDPATLAQVLSVLRGAQAC